MDIATLLQLVLTIFCGLFAVGITAVAGHYRRRAERLRQDIATAWVWCPNRHYCELCRLQKRLMP